VLVKAIIVFLALIAVIGWIGSWIGRLRNPLRREAACPACGRPRMGKGACPCGRA